MVCTCLKLVLFNILEKQIESEREKLTRERMCLCVWERERERLNLIRLLKLLPFKCAILRNRFVSPYLWIKFERNIGIFLFCLCLFSFALLKQKRDWLETRGIEWWICRSGKKENRNNFERVPNCLTFEKTWLFELNLVLPQKFKVNYSNAKTVFTHTHRCR